MMESGEQCVVIIGETQMLPLCADNFRIPLQVQHEVYSQQYTSYQNPVRFYSIDEAIDNIRKSVSCRISTQKLMGIHDVHVPI